MKRCEEFDVRKCFIPIGVAMLIATQVSSIVFAGNSVTIVAPIANKSKSGLTVQVTSTGLSKIGYRPVNVTVASAVPATAERSLAIEINPNFRSYRAHNTTIRFEIEIAEGATTASTNVLLPQLSDWGNFNMNVYEDGVQIQDLSGDQRAAFQQSRQGDLTEANPGWLVIDDGNMTSSRFFSFKNSNWLTAQNGPLRSSSRFSSNTPANQIESYVSGLPLVDIRKPAELMDDWKFYSSYDIVVAELSTLEKLSTTRPDAWEAIDTFVRLGGNLIVFGVGESPDDFQHEPVLNRLLGLDLDGNSADSSVNPKWESPRAEDYGRPATELLNEQRSRSQRIFRNATVVDAQVTALPTSNPNEGQTAPMDKPRFRLRHHFSGMVVSISAAAPFTGSDRWDWIMTSLNNGRLKWYQRHGLSQVRTNRGFWNLMIPGIKGLAPITFFLFLISAFVIGIGPLNYWFLKKVNRLYLLLFTVPVAALLVTLGLLAFAFVAHGIDTKARYRSFTNLDSRTGKMTSWSRQMYYASLKPSRGLSYPDTAVVYPLDYRADEFNDKRFIQWGDGQQHLMRGFIQSRSLTQFLVLNAAKTEIGLRIKPAENGLAVQNELGVDLTHLLIVDKDQGVYFADQVMQAKTKLAKSMSLQDARVLFRDLIVANEPRVASDMRYPTTRRRYNRYFDRNEPQASTSGSILELGIKESMLLKLPSERVYFAVSNSRPASVPSGIQHAKETAGFHVIKGTW